MDREGFDCLLGSSFCNVSDGRAKSLESCYKWSLGLLVKSSSRQPHNWPTQRPRVGRRSTSHGFRLV
jgi:hypothetical protein